MFRAIACMMLLALLVSGCETTAGFGRDMQRAGNWIEEKAER
ncbi:MAG: entericidin A/B family lipoprotein [Deltaproteobacteria bacterium]|nr:MAG: entericidin A/B family lipoprotein [Deltaproteobacteria bacterium]